MSNFDLSISPAQIEFVLKPGVTITQAYTIINNSTTPLYLDTKVLPWYPTGDDGSVNYQNILPNPKISFSLANANLQLEKPFTIPSQGSQQLVLKIKTDSTADLGDAYYTFFIYQNQNTIKSDNTSAQATGQIGSHILLSISQSEIQTASGNVKKFSITPKIKDVFFTPINFTGDIQNNTNYFFKTTGRITITKNNQTIKEINLDPSNVLAHHYRRLNCQENIGCILNPPLWPGHYTATLSFDENIKVPPSSVSFYVFPFSPIIFFIFIGAIFSCFKFFKKFWKPSK